MKLEVGMYVRTKHKGIVKIDEVIDNGVITYEDDLGREWEEETGRKVIRYIGKDGWNCGLDEKEITKASHNIIDLIEEGDFIDYSYPTGLGILRFKRVEVTEGLLNILQNGENNHEYKIEAVVTKEQFESMSYLLEKESDK